MLLVILVGGIIGFCFAEFVHRRNVKKMKSEQQRNALIAEFIDKQLWQFLSLDEWLVQAAKEDSRNAR